VGQYIAGQLRAIYDEVAAEPIPDRLLQLLDRLSSNGKKLTARLFVKYQETSRIGFATMAPAAR
jgi:hypothetical protein